MCRNASLVLTRGLAVVVLICGSTLVGAVSASAARLHPHHVSTTYTAYAFGEHDSPAPASDPDCYGSQSTEVVVTGRPSNWHLRLHQSDWVNCSSCEYTTDVDEDLGLGEFWMSRSLKRARLSADVTLSFGCPDGGTAPAHISAVWSGRGRVTTTIATSTQDGHRYRTLTKTRGAAFQPLADPTFAWPADQPPSAYLRSERTCQK
jgi:hypothetical protein